MAGGRVGTRSYTRENMKRLASSAYSRSSTAVRQSRPEWS
jgi:hypothetical protein